MTGGHFLAVFKRIEEEKKIQFACTLEGFVHCTPDALHSSNGFETPKT